MSTEERSQGASSGGGMTAAIIDTSVHVKTRGVQRYSPGRAPKSRSSRNGVRCQPPRRSLQGGAREKSGAGWCGRDSSVCARVPSELYKPAGFPSMPHGKDGKRQCRSPSIYQHTRDPQSPTLGKFTRINRQVSEEQNSPKSNPFSAESRSIVSRLFPSPSRSPGSRPKP